MSVERITIGISAVAAYITVITANLMMKMGHVPTPEQIAEFKKQTTQAVRDGALLLAPEDYRDLRELLSAAQTAEKFKGEEQSQNNPDK